MSVTHGSQRVKGPVSICCLGEGVWKILRLHNFQGGIEGGLG